MGDGPWRASPVAVVDDRRITGAALDVALVGRLQEASDLFDSLCSRANPLGL